MKKISTQTTIYKFPDMKIVTINNHESKITDVYVEVDSNLEFVFGVPEDQKSAINIKALHENGYFADYSYKDKAERFLKGETI